MEKVIEIIDVSKTYMIGEEIEIRALRGVSFTIERGEFVAIMGASGSGKSTLMNLIGCLDRPTSGHYLLEGVDVASLDEETTGLDSQPPHRLHLPEFQPAVAHQHARKCRTAAVLFGLAGRRCRARAKPGRDGRAERPRAQPSEPALRRPAAARRDCPRADQRTRDPAGRRADRQSRFGQFRRNPGDDDAAESRPWPDGDNRHPRPGGGRLRRPRHHFPRRRDRFRYP